ncbi:B3 domain-containing transcription factor ABI3 isoform X3 [Ziziphus jujuba]|nr:B3 domain-containing transcription factor ABI3 isoform X3 [Ziziphus jujuba]XP_048336182.2 B3 domain-containing transcription factor ABI3 isoform X3 [Ziziphus jujuba]
MKGVEAQDLHAGGNIMAENHLGGFCDMGNEEVLGVDGREIWLDHNEQEDLLDMSDTSIFYNDFPPLPDFPCMSSSSSSSSTPAPVKAITCSSSSSSPSSSSSAASWAVLKSDAEEDVEKKQHNINKNNNHQHHDQHQQHSQDDPVDAPPAALSSTASMEIPQLPDQGLDCMDMMETFGYMELLEGNEFIDPSSIFENESPFDDFQLEQDEQTHRQQEHAEYENPNQQQQQQQVVVAQNNNNNNEEEEFGEEAAAAVKDEEEGDDMATVFLEWLRSNRETVSAEDLRSVKIKKATIECAARRLGGGKEAMKQLLKLVLEWVQTNHLQKRRTTTTKETAAPTPPFPNNQYQDPNFQNPNLINSNSFTHESNTCFNQSPWMSQSPYDPTTNGVVAHPPPAAAAYPSPMVGYMGGTDPFVNGGCGGGSNVNANQYATTPSEYHMLDTPQTWPSSQFAMASHYTPYPDNNLQPAPPPPAPPQSHPQTVFSGYGNQYPAYQYYHGNGGDQRLVRLGSSATKEARKKRMARQRRLLSHHRHHNHHHHHNSGSQQSQSAADQHARLGSSDNCTMAAAAAAAVQANPGNWVYWPSAAAASGIPSAPPSMIQGIPAEAPVLRPVDRMQVQNYQGRLASEHRRQGWKPEKNLKFLLQKVLKQSDVGSLGRIVLPKKEAETHLPELEARDGISIAMEDIGTSRVWNMRYSFRYWPNNKSRMYLLENTGDFVRANGLQEGDFIVIYSDVKCGKYMIRGVKVRQQGAKSETKRPGKSQRNNHGSTPAGGNGSSSSPNKKQ